MTEKITMEFLQPEKFPLWLFIVYIYMFEKSETKIYRPMSGLKLQLQVTLYYPNVYRTF